MRHSQKAPKYQLDDSTILDGVNDSWNNLDVAVNRARQPKIAALIYFQAYRKRTGYKFLKTSQGELLKMIPALEELENDDFDRVQIAVNNWLQDTRTLLRQCGIIGADVIPEHFWYYTESGWELIPGWQHWEWPENPSEFYNRNYRAYFR